ncbi:MAG: hypothetical protein ACREP9_22540, partial [Candidatus Dormibacteraceae bacterium]
MIELFVVPIDTTKPPTELIFSASLAPENLPPAGILVHAFCTPAPATDTPAPPLMTLLRGGLSGLAGVIHLSQD